MKTEANYRNNHFYTLNLTILSSVIILTGLLYGILLTQTASAQEQYTTDNAKYGLAVPYLDTLATKRARQRKAMGGVSIGMGIGSGIFGTVLLSKSNDDGLHDIDHAFGKLFLITGITSTIGGILTLSVISRQEKRHREVMNITNPNQRAYAADKALRDLARQARTGRIIGAGISALGIAYFMGTAESEQDVWTYYFIGVTLLNLATKSLEERILREYQKQRERTGGADFSIGAGIHPSGSGVLQIKVSF
ncbi:MAG: hypothetical protein R3222_09605 [Balneolaceae bacterium]|nr:hypothetical protein [Balneolaceae bacterium]